MNQKTPIDILIEKGYEDIIVFQNPNYTTALIGVSNYNQAVYDYDLMIDWLMQYEDMTYEESADFISYNDSFHYGKDYPVIYYGSYEYDEVFDEDSKIVFTKLEDLPDRN